MERNPNWRGDRSPSSTRSSSSSTATRTRSSGRSSWARSTWSSRSSRPASTGSATQPNIDTVRSSSPAYTELAFNLCPQDNCPDAKFNPAVQDRDRAPGDRLRGRPRADQRDRRPRHLVPRPRDPAAVLQVVLPDAGAGLPATTPTRRTRSSTTPAGRAATTGVRDEGRRGALVQPLRPLRVAVQHPGGEAGRRGGQGRSGSTSTSRWSAPTSSTDLTTQKKNGKPAPDFDTFIWGWGGDPYDPSFLLSILTTERDRRLVGLLLLEPRVRPALRGAGRLVRHRASARRSIQQMVAITQRDLPYLVLTYDPNLQAYRTDRIGERQAGQCPEDQTGDIICEQVSLRAAADDRARRAPSGGGRQRRRASRSRRSSWSSAASAVLRDRRSRASPRAREPLELED